MKQVIPVRGICSNLNCKRPNCFCPSRTSPGNMDTKVSPQLVLFTFDDAINERNIDYYRRLFRKTRPNPNGCPPTATFFVSNEWTNYDMVREMYVYGHEIASHSVTHRLPQSWWGKATYKDWDYEIQGQRLQIGRRTGIPLGDIKGMRAPFLQIGGDVQFDLLVDNGFEYDASFLTGQYNERHARDTPPLWPFTLDNPPVRPWCDITPCPQKAYPGFMEVPLIYWIGLDGKICPMIDACLKPKTENETFTYLWNNFRRYYDSNKAPFGINMHAVWFDESFRLKAMDRFIDELHKLPDVYIISIHQMIAWMKNATALSDLDTFEPWKTSCQNNRLTRVSQAVTESVSQGQTLSKINNNHVLLLISCLLLWYFIYRARNVYTCTHRKYVSPLSHIHTQ